eukprot:6349418-Lingulodinium_polyedra.AAC.1
MGIAFGLVENILSSASGNTYPQPLPRRRTGGRFSRSRKSPSTLGARQISSSSVRPPKGEDEGPV